MQSLNALFTGCAFLVCTLQIQLFCWLWLVAGANLLLKKSTAGWLVAGADLV
jgi:hypothetical protein